MAWDAKKEWTPDDPLTPATVQQIVRDEIEWKAKQKKGEGPFVGQGAETASSGRPHYPDDIWAWKQIHELHIDSKTIYKEWVKRPAIIERNLVDPSQQFKRIKKRSWYKR